MSVFFFFNDTATTEIYTLSLHDALPISVPAAADTTHIDAMLGSNARDHRGDELLAACRLRRRGRRLTIGRWSLDLDRKSTRLNSSHANISYAVFCLKKKNN